MNNSQLLKGTLEGCVLAILNTKEVYGYELVYLLRQKGFNQVVGGTIYPLLQKLERQGCVTSIKRPSEDGPDRKYYTLTAKGQQQLAQFDKEWQILTTIVADLLHTNQEEQE